MCESVDAATYQYLDYNMQVQLSYQALEIEVKTTGYKRFVPNIHPKKPLTAMMAEYTSDSKLLWWGSRVVDFYNSSYKHVPLLL
jgi:hypothetical protein